MELFNIDWVAIVITMIMIVYDFVTGMLKAVKCKNVSSSIMREGLLHKTAYLLVIALAIILEAGMEHLELGIVVPLLVPVCGWIVLTEAASSLENIAVINPELKNNPIFSVLDSVKGDNDA